MTMSTCVLAAVADIPAGLPQPAVPVDPVSAIVDAFQIHRPSVEPTCKPTASLRSLKVETD
jgi:hypothetical protein